VGYEPVYNPSNLVEQIAKPENDWWDTIKNASGEVLVVGLGVTVAYGVSVVITGCGSSVVAPAYAAAMGLLLTSGTAATISVHTAKDQTAY
jgi:hypothetical protein